MLPTALCFVVLTLGVGVILSGLFAVNANQSLEQYLTVQLDGLASAVRTTRKGEMVLAGDGVTDPRFFQPSSGWYWQIQRGDYSLRSKSLWDKALIGTRLTLITEKEQQGLRMLSRTVRYPELKDPVTFVVSANLNETRQSIAHFNRILLLSMGLMAVGLFSALYWRMRLAFRPLAHIRAETVKIHRGVKERIEGKFPPEISPLTNEINLLLKKNQKTLVNVRRNVGNLAHALKTPLTVILNSLPEGEATVRHQADQMRHIINRYLSRAAGSGNQLGEVRSISEPKGEAQKIIQVLKRLYPHLSFSLKGKAHKVRMEAEDLQEILGNLMENAAKWAKSEVSVTFKASGARLVITVEDNGKGIPKTQLKKVLERGKRLDETTQGSGIGLAIVADAVLLANGKLRLANSAKGGLKATVQLPLAG